MKMRLLALLPAAFLLASCNKETPTPAVSEKPADTAPAPTASAVKPVDVPAGYGYPGNRAEFQAWADTWQIDNITTAAWNLWAGMTSDSGQMWEGANLPVWETWCGISETFSKEGCVAGMTRPSRAFQAASQIAHGARKAGLQLPADTNVVSFNKFNPSMAAYLAAQHPGPGGVQYSYTSMQSQVDLNAAWPQGTAVADRKVVDAPYQPDNGDAIGFAGMETKPVIFLVKATGLTPMPLWQGTQQSTTPVNATPETWLTCVLLDPTNKGGPDTAPVAATPEQIKQAVPSPSLACQSYLYAPLSTIYNFRMDQADADNWNRNLANNGDQGQGLKAAAGDFGVLAGMHVNSKTIVNWTWETFWWQPGPDAPNNFPGSKQGMTANVKGAWRNYAMCTAWNQTKGNASSEMVVCFNPFLETSSGIPAGQTSNCMSCHGVATFGAAAVSGTPPVNAATTMNYPASYTAPIDFSSNACTQSTPPGSQTCFADFTKTDFSWAMPGNARNDLPQPSAPPVPPAADAGK